MSEWDEEVEEITTSIGDLEKLIASAKADRETASGLSVAALDAGIKSLEASLAEMNKRRDRLDVMQVAERAYESPLGQLATAAYRHVQYDYAEEENYPGIVAAMEAKLNELGLELVKSGG